MIDWREFRAMFLLIFLMMGLAGLGILMSFIGFPVSLPSFGDKDAPEQIVVEAPRLQVNGISTSQSLVNPVVRIERLETSIFDPVQPGEMPSPSQGD